MFCKSFAVLAAALFVAPAAAQVTAGVDAAVNATAGVDTGDITGTVGTVTGLVCGVAGAANFIKTSELLAAVKCLTTLQGCNSTDLPVEAQTDLLDLGILGPILASGSLDAVLNGGVLNLNILTSVLVDGGVLQNLLDNGLLDIGLLGGLGGVVDGLLGDVTDVVAEVLDLVENLLANLLGYYGNDISSWCTGLLSNLDGVFAGLTEFNQPLNWDISGVTSLVGTFKGAKAFNQDISGWVVKDVCDLTNFLKGATSFNQNLNAWLPQLVNSKCDTTPDLTNIVKNTACDITETPVLPNGPICQALTTGNISVNVDLNKCLRQTVRTLDCNCSSLTKCVNKLVSTCLVSTKKLRITKSALRSKALSIATNKCK